MWLTPRDQKEFFNFGRQGFGVCIILLGLTTLLFGSDTEFEANFIFWQKYGFWQELGPQTASTQSYFSIWKGFISFALILAGGLMFEKNPYGPIISVVMLVLRGLHHANPAIEQNGSDFELHRSWSNMLQFLAMLGGCFLVLSKGNEELSKTVRIDSPLK